MKTNEEMKKVVMRRVWGIYLLRQLMRPAVRLSVFAVAVFAFAGYVSVSSVLQNAYSKGGLIDLFDFALSAFLNTEVLVQLSILVIGLILVSSIIDLARSIQKQPLTT